MKPAKGQQPRMQKFNTANHCYDDATSETSSRCPQRTARTYTSTRPTWATCAYTSMHRWTHKVANMHGLHEEMMHKNLANAFLPIFRPVYTHACMLENLLLAQLRTCSPASSTYATSMLACMHACLHAACLPKVSMAACAKIQHELRNQKKA